MRHPSLVAVAALVLAGVARGAPGGEVAASRPRLVATSGSRCRLMQAGAEGTTSRDCVACHSATGRDSHPVDLDYEGARTTGAGQDLRPLPEVVRRGVLVPNGQLRCVTCHDGRSPWKYRIALPPGAVPRPAVNPRDPRTYEGRGEPPEPLAPGSEVTPTPLCLACHALD
jgi:hypothetical protein